MYLTEMKVNQVDLFYTVPMILNIPIGLFGLYFVDIIGLKKTLWFCTLCCTIGNFIRLATLFHDGSNYDDCKQSINGIVIDADFPEWYCPSLDWNYKIALIGSAIASVGKGFGAAVPSKLTAEWFSQSEYDLVNSLASLADSLGAMLAFLILPFIAKEPSNLLHIQLYIEIAIALSFIGSLFIKQEGYNFEVRDQSLKGQIVT